jgi:cytochrome c peroxidase
MKRYLALPTLVTVLALSPVAAHNGDEQQLTDAREHFRPLPASFATTDHPLTPERVALGRQLFFDPRISLDGTMSCASCHQPALYGTDALPKSYGVLNRPLPRNAPTVLNTAGQFVQHFGGNRKDVEDQAMRALVSPLSYGNPDFNAAMSKLTAIPGYRPLFEKAFPDDPDPIRPENWGAAIGAFERTLVTPGPLDLVIAGDIAAMPAQARYGMGKFIRTGCAGCHNGALVGGTTYQKFGLVVDYWTATKSQEIDKGRFVDTKNDADLYIFKVPSLRNVAKTAPYFHDGSVAKLGDAVRVMALTQLGKRLSDEDVEDIVAFLEALTGDMPASFREAPILPPGPFTATP